MPQDAAILIIEDDDLFFDALNNRLIKKGIKVERARTGAEGLNKGKRGSYNLIITDIVLPKMNGFEIINILRRDYGRKTPFMVISNLGLKTMSLDKSFSESLGIVRYLVKSNYSITEIANQIIDYLK